MTIGCHCFISSSCFGPSPSPCGLDGSAWSTCRHLPSPRCAINTYANTRSGTTIDDGWSRKDDDDDDDDEDGCVEFNWLKGDDEDSSAWEIDWGECDWPRMALRLPSHRNTSPSPLLLTSSSVTVVGLAAAAVAAAAEVAAAVVAAAVVAAAVEAAVVEGLVIEALGRGRARSTRMWPV